MKIGVNNLCSDNVNVEGIKSLLDPECKLCNIHNKILNKERCKGCIFILNSAQVKGKPSRVGCGAKLKIYGILHPNHLGRLHLFIFIYYPKLNFQFPAVPFKDVFGNTIYDKHLMWHVHHINGNHNDNRKINLLLCLNTEHGYLSKKPNCKNVLYEVKKRNSLLNF